MTPGDIAQLGEQLAALPSAEREHLLAAVGPRALAALRYAWRLYAREKQVEPAGDWRVWLVLAGRGFGKTRTGAEWVREQVEQGRAKRGVILVAPTAAAARDIMVEGESGILSISPSSFRPDYEPSKLRLTWPDGTVGHIGSAEEPDRLRGYQGEIAWVDELAAWQYADESWSMLQFCLRVGTTPRICATTTPRPTDLIKRLVGLCDPARRVRRVHVTRGTTYENIGNLAKDAVDELRALYEGTRLGRQELEAEVLEDVPGALWTRAQIDGHRLRAKPASMRRIVIGVDPAVSTNKLSDETGILVVGVEEDHAYVLEDLSGVHSPDKWARLVVEAYRRHQADRVVAEVNNGGNLVEANLRTVDKSIPYRAVRAKKAKHTRAEPVAALYEQGRVHHVGPLHKLEDQMVSWSPSESEDSPDRVDALVWAITDLLISPRIPSFGDGTTGGPRRLGDPSRSPLGDWEDD